MKGVFMKETPALGTNLLGGCMWLSWLFLGLDPTMR